MSPNVITNLPAVLELVELERKRWPEVAARIPAWHPRNEGDDDADKDADKTKDADKDKTGDADKDKDKSKRKAGDKGDDDDDDDDTSELARARSAVAAANRELKAIKDKATKDEAEAKKQAGKYQELYESTQAELDKLKGEVTTSTKSRLAEAALTVAKAKNPARAVNMLDLDEIDDEADATRAVKRLLKSDPYLFDTAQSRQKRDGGKDGDDDDKTGDDDKPKSKRPVNRLRRGLEATTPK